MTLLPSSEFGIKGHEGKAYRVNEICCAPGCFSRSVHTHHLWPRSFLRGQPCEWVELPDGTVVGNRVGLCLRHHEQVTGEIGGYRAWISFASGLFWWEEREASARGWNRVDLIDPQPPGVAEQPKPSPTQEEVCPTCGHHKRKSELKPTAKRKSKTWTLDVPDDAEIGTEILDGWADDIAIILGMEDERSRLRRYHAVATGLAWVIQNRETFISDVVEAIKQ